jgi:hypothetical protein
MIVLCHHLDATTSPQFPDLLHLSASESQCLALSVYCNRFDENVKLNSLFLFLNLLAVFAGGACTFQSSAICTFGHMWAPSLKAPDASLETFGSLLFPSSRICAWSRSARNVWQHTQELWILVDQHLYPGMQPPCTLNSNQKIPPVIVMGIIDNSRRQVSSYRSRWNERNTQQIFINASATTMAWLDRKRESQGVEREQHEMKYLHVIILTANPLLSCTIPIKKGKSKQPSSIPEWVPKTSLSTLPGVRDALSNSSTCTQKL